MGNEGRYKMVEASNYIGVTMGGYIDENNKLMDRTELNRRIHALQNNTEITKLKETIQSMRKQANEWMEEYDTLRREKPSLLKQIDDMKCCMNCKHVIHGEGCGLLDENTLEGMLDSSEQCTHWEMRVIDEN